MKTDHGDALYGSPFGAGLRSPRRLPVLIPDVQHRVPERPRSETPGGIRNDGWRRPNTMLFWNIIPEHAPYQVFGTGIRAF